mgnify:FL=1|jgi:hypothetical protein
MGEIIYDVVLNVKYAGCRQQLHVTTGEVNARKLRIKLTNGAVPIKLNQYTDTAIMRGVKSDKKLIYNTAKITEEGNVEYTLGSQDTVSGKTWYEVQVLRKDGDVEPKIIYSAQFKVEVNNKLYDDGSVTSTNQFGVLEDTIETARSWMNEKDADIDSRTLTCIEKFGYTEDDNTTPNTRKDPSNENSGIIFTAPKIPVDFDYIKAEQIDTDQYALRIQVFKDDEKINTVTVAGQQNVQIVDVRGATYIQIEVIGMPPDVDGKPEHFRLEKLKLFSGALGDVVEKVNKHNHWKGKTWYAYGTSLTDISQVGQYCKTVRNLSNLILTNKGISGGGICANTLIKDAIMNITDGKTNADLITLEVGANDTSSAIGTIYDTGNDTFCGALNQCIRYLQKNTNAQIVVISSTNSRYKSDDKTVEFTPDKTFGADNHTKYDQWKATKEVCAINSVPYIPMGEAGGMGYARMIASDQYNIDNIHHTVCGGRNLGEFVWSKLKDIPLWSSEEVVAVPIIITTQPQSVDSAVGNVVSFMVEAQGDGLTYQWQLSNDGGTTWGNTSVNGNTTKFISFAIPGANYSGRMFRCVITDANGNTLASNPAKLTLNGVHDVTITSQPQDISAKVGDTINISVVAKSSKSNKLTYQWQVSSTGETWSNTTVTGYNTSALNFAIPNANYNGRQYRCLVTEGNGSWALSDAMKLTVTS